jgi:hypothetical protein
MEIVIFHIFDNKNEKHHSFAIMNTFLGEKKEIIWNKVFYTY